jgi:hypothetical protein
MTKKQTHKVDLKTTNRGENAAVPNVVVPGLAPSINSERKSEQAYKMLMELIKNPHSVEGLIVGRDKEGNFQIHKLLKDKQGKWMMPNNLDEWKVPSIWDIIRKKRRINKIMVFPNPILKRDIGDVTKTALMRKTDDQLEKLYANLKNKEKRQRTSVRNRIGCIYIETDDESIQI